MKSGGSEVWVVVRNLHARHGTIECRAYHYLLEKQIRSILRACLLAATLGVTAAVGAAQGGRFEIVTGKLFEAAVPGDFYLEGNAIPVEKQNAVLIRTPSGTRALLALIATAGFASEIQQKYSGMLTSEGHLAICGKAVAVGSYGFGIRRPRLAGQQELFFVYNQAGKRVMECSMEKDVSLREPRPLQVVVGSAEAARLYLGRYWIGLSP